MVASDSSPAVRKRETPCSSGVSPEPSHEITTNCGGASPAGTFFAHAPSLPLSFPWPCSSPEGSPDSLGSPDASPDSLDSLGSADASPDSLGSLDSLGSADASPDSLGSADASPDSPSLLEGSPDPSSSEVGDPPSEEFPSEALLLEAGLELWSPSESPLHAVTPIARQTATAAPCTIRRVPRCARRMGALPPLLRGGPVWPPG
ncbi:hypothetical protein BJF82_05665 [Kytococcus sp. CUA-901]|nr:hypothetical protein BJF82_05665 [Kytococcus sp. CUA-901]